jgi:integrase
MAVLPERATCQVATAAFTGMRLSELKGLRWENYDGKELHVAQSIWRGIVSDPKTRKSRAAVPVIEPLTRLLERHRAETGNPTSGWIFTQNFEYLARRVIRPVLQHAGLKWHGWHAFRRGLATNLYRLGVPDKTIQAILRHSNLSTTMNVYVKTVSADSTTAMAHLERVCTSMQRAEDDAEQVVM